jgi:hypothetical protein
LCRVGFFQRPYRATTLIVHNAGIMSTSWEAARIQLVNSYARPLDTGPLVIFLAFGLEHHEPEGQEIDFSLDSISSSCGIPVALPLSRSMPLSRKPT